MDVKRSRKYPTVLSVQRNHRRLIVITIDYCERDLYRKLKLPFNYNLLRMQFQTALINDTTDGYAAIDDGNDGHERG